MAVFLQSQFGEYNRAHILIILWFTTDGLYNYPHKPVIFDPSQGVLPDNEPFEPFSRDNEASLYENATQLEPLNAG